MWETINRIFTKTMREFTVKEWEERFDELIECVGKGEAIAIHDTTTGKKAVFVPEELSHLCDHDDAC